MKPLIWQTSEKFKNKHIMDYKWRERVTDIYIFMGGKILPSPDVGRLRYFQDPKNYDLVFVSESPPKEFLKFDCLPNNSTGKSPLVNKKVLDIFNKLCPNDIQAFQATIIPDKKSKHSFENHDYWLINITKQMDVIDLENSDLSFFEEDPSSIFIIKRLRFLNNIDPDITFIARVSNDHSLQIVSPSLAQAFKDAKVTGVRFIEDKEYS